MYIKALENDKDILFAKILPTVIEQKSSMTMHNLCIIIELFARERPRVNL